MASGNKGSARHKGTATTIVAVLTTTAAAALGGCMLARPPKAYVRTDTEDAKEIDGVVFYEPVREIPSTGTLFKSIPEEPAPTQADPAPEVIDTQSAPEPPESQEAQAIDVPTAEPAAPEEHEDYTEPGGMPVEERYERAVFPVIPDPVPGDADMNADEASLAHEIFDRYNEWRASCGLPTTTWDGVCAEMAMGSAKGCATNMKLIHRLGIPADLQDCYSDILQYASWRMTAEEAVDRWTKSDGHAAQMRCPTARNAACGVYRNENGIYWFAIVYTFEGYNFG